MNEFYGTQDGLIAYVVSRGIEEPDLEPSEWIAALLVASEWIDAKYRSRFSGVKLGGRDQARQWPRKGAFDYDQNEIPENEIPREVEHATYEAAMRQANTPGSLSPDFTPNKFSQASVDGAVSVTFAEFMSASDAQTIFTSIDQVIAPVLTSENGGSALYGFSQR